MTEIPVPGPGGRIRPVPVRALRSPGPGGPTSAAPVVIWFRRDLRVADQPTFLAAGQGARALALFVLDPRLLRPSGDARKWFLFGCLRALDESLGGRLLVVEGDPAQAVPLVADAAGAGEVHVAADFGPYGSSRDREVEQALAARGATLVRTGSPYAVAPGRVRSGDGGRYRVFTPFRRAWADHGWRAPARTDAGFLDWIDPATVRARPAPVPAGPDVVADLPEPGEAAARDRWRDFLDHGLSGYADGRDRPDRPGTSRMSVYLKYGCVHPRTLLADLAGDGSEGARSFRGELAWREFYADVLDQRPDSARRNYDPAFDGMATDGGRDAEVLFAAWREGRTGFPVVDAGMRQLLAEGWMHNRVRMITASFLVKDLHLPWWWGARHFMRRLVDGDLASNQHGWQWVAGSGTDAAPYFRVFNPVLQGERFDPEGNYVRTYVPELAGVPGRAVHQPWRLPEGPPGGYPAPVVDHQHERAVALERYEAVKAARSGRAAPGRRPG
ncbi:cryptochrome/photolyase family protein [Myceligenerans indicum]|uniref:Deoxyribodipyrimidine photo-lyase n=1 Tax=Myceligenerans indicum TaxID=2593663 RepID=A0ABS1LJ90_9MICO|nr:deoxyribodipyrimidine photo-lyase [Myceligenerans indicum]MBL0886305.1 deoxyribodipyrimidine photo-lyase [Myceligenerans indicum]